jgi:hypothetical protein
LVSSVTAEGTARAAWAAVILGPPSAASATRPPREVSDVAPPRRPCLRSVASSPWQAGPSGDEVGSHFTQGGSESGANDSSRVASTRPAVPFVLLANCPWPLTHDAVHHEGWSGDSYLLTVRRCRTAPGSAHCSVESSRSLR